MKPKIYWNKSERAILFDSLVSVLSKRPLLDKRAALVAAQNALPKNRRREITAHAAWTEKEFVERARALANERWSGKTITVTPGVGEVTIRNAEIESMLKSIADAISSKILARVHANLNAAINKNDVVLASNKDEEKKEQQPT